MPTAALSTRTHPDEDEDFGVSNSVFALGDADHRELGWTGAFLDQVANLNTDENIKIIKIQSLQNDREHVSLMSLLDQYYSLVNCQSNSSPLYIVCKYPAAARINKYICRPRWQIANDCWTDFLRGAVFACVCSCVQ